MAGKYDATISIKTTWNQSQDLEGAAARLGVGQTELVRACIAIALPILLETPPLIPLLQPGILQRNAQTESDS